MYRLKHKATGLYYVPNRTLYVKTKTGKTTVQSNLSKTGKVYHNKPPISSIRAIYNHTTLTYRYNEYVKREVGKSSYEVTGPDTWEVEVL